MADAQTAEPQRHLTARLFAAAFVPPFAALGAQRAAAPEWPVDGSALSFPAIHVAIPLASWIGGALVERGPDLALR